MEAVSKKETRDIEGTFLRMVRPWFLMHVDAFCSAFVFFCPIFSYYKMYVPVNTSISDSEYPFCINHQKRYGSLNLSHLNLAHFAVSDSGCLSNILSEFPSFW